MLNNRSMPRPTVVPVLAYPDVQAAADWLCAAFGFRMRLRIGEHRIQLHAGEGSVVLAAHTDPAAFADSGAQVLHSVMVRIEDVDGHHQQAVAHGARVLQPPQDYTYGERQYTVADLAGHRWTFSQTIADVDPADWSGEIVEED
jgi:uncharacterized glyoxalase superfamily protein PhnB